jgi:hypothetical protein
LLLSPYLHTMADDPIAEMPALPLMSLVTGDTTFCLSTATLLRHPYRVYRWIGKGILACPSLALRAEHWVKGLEFWLGPRLESYSPAVTVTVSDVVPRSPKPENTHRQVIGFQTAQYVSLLTMNLPAASGLIEMMHGPYHLEADTDSVAAHGGELLTIDALGAFFAARAGLTTLPLACTFHLTNAHDLQRAHFSLGDEGVYSVSTE